MKLARLLVRPRLPRPDRGHPPRRRCRRSSARAAVASGCLAFLACTVALAATVETAKPEWRDPEFGHRLRQLRHWQTRAPQRPLVLAFGSSRTQMGISPAAMGFPDEHDSPLVYNFGYRGSRQLGTWLHLNRLRDAGVKPNAVLIQIAAPELVISGSAETQYAAWVPRLGFGDVNRWEPYTKNPAALRWELAWVRAKPWISHREAILSDILPDWQTPTQRRKFSWEWMDEYGFAPHPSVTVDPVRRAELHRHVRSVHARSLNRFAPSEIVHRVLSDLVALCRAEGVPVALYWAPTSPAYRTWVSPSSREALAAYHERLVRELGVPVFPAPDHLTEDDFVDGDHLIIGGALRYSRWLADTHLKPWLASHGLGR